MKIDDPRLTAYALGELPEEERRALEQDLVHSPEARAYVVETQQLARQLEREFQTELAQADAPTADILPMPYGRLFWSERNWPVLAIAAVLVALVSVVGVLFWRGESVGSSTGVAGAPAGGHSEDVIVEFGAVENEVPTESSSATNEKAFTSVSSNPVSTFPMRVGTGSFQEMRKSINEGRRPPKSAVRIEEMINHFAYSYPPPPLNEQAVMVVDAASCPWTEGHQLVRIGVHARESAAARFVEVRFNPSEVQSYRLLGYDESLGGSDATTGRDATPQRIVTALYEIARAPRLEATAAQGGGELLKATLRHSGASTGAIADQTLGGDVRRFEEAPADFRFAAAVAEFGMLLRDSPYKGAAKLPMVIAWADGAKGEDPERAGFVELLRKSESLL
jgi:hypothetical protein